VDATVQRQVFRLVRQRIDMRPRMLGRDDDPRRSGTRLGRAMRVMTVEEVVEAGLVCGV